jgi:hydroxyacyl-ACP dehydratase HTD2-like protein with hotdog domain
MTTGLEVHYNPEFGDAFCMSKLLTSDLLANIGRSAPPRTELVTRRDIRKYSVATGQRLQKYLGGDEAPPMFHVALFWDVVELDELTPDGVSIDSLIPKFPLERAMAGGLRIDYHRSIFPGDVLVSTRTLTDIYEKQGSKGPLIFYEVTMQVTDQAGEPVLTEKTTRILR